MSKSAEEKISEALEIEFVPDTKIQKIEKVVKEVKIKKKDQVNQDFTIARQNMKELISMGFNAIDGIMKVADAGDSPRAYEVASILIKTVSELNSDLIDLHKKKTDAIGGSKVVKNTTNNSIFVGSTKDLQNIINQSRSQLKNLNHEEES
jgi:hypothetical protein